MLIPLLLRPDLKARFVMLGHTASSTVRGFKKIFVFPTPRLGRKALC